MVNEHTIRQYLEQLGVAAPPYTDSPSATPGVSFKLTQFSYGGLQSILLVLEVPDLNVLPGGSYYGYVDFGFGFLPKTNIAPLFRRLLVLQGSLGTVKFCLNDQSNLLSIRNGRYLEGMDFDEFKNMIDSLNNVFWSQIPAIKQEFPISNQPT